MRAILCVAVLLFGPLASALVSTAEALMTTTATSRVVLVVDDDDDIRTAVQEVLEGEGYATQGASNGREALDILRASSDPPARKTDTARASVVRIIHSAAREVLWRYTC